MKNKTHLLAQGFVTGKAFQVRKAELVKDYCLKAIPCKKRDKNSVLSNSLVIPHHWCVSTSVKASSTTHSFVVTSSVSAWQLCFCLWDAFITPSLHNAPCVFKHCVYYDRFSSLLWDGSTCHPFSDSEEFFIFKAKYACLLKWSWNFCSSQLQAEIC